MIKKIPTILVVEDDSDLSGLMQRKLSLAGWQPRVVETGREALDYLNQQAHPDLIVLDIALPDIDGLTVLNELAHTVNLHDIPVIIFSNIDEPRSIDQVRAIGNYDYLLKSRTELNKLVTKIKEKLGIVDK